MEQRHFVLVHGACHGAWCWYKIQPLLEAAGHRVTVLDMAGAGVHRKAIQEVKSLEEYSEPLLKTMACVGPNEKVILVGHSFGGMSLALAMEKFPHNISASVFLTALAPDTHHHPSYVSEQFLESLPKEFWMDTQSCGYENRVDDEASSSYFLFGPKCMANFIYHLSPSEDLALGKSLVRPGSLLVEELAKAEKFTEENYGSVKKVYVICGEDKTIPKHFQKWMIQNYGIQNVMEIEGADHMPMFSKPLQVLQCLLQVAHNFT
ncbi:salicylic acid-binding protein 2-like isoform X1 [Benincasa hispida]|uniref:salicylic acid-binding protein 2-like isoform X1 n=1 Tax=Benincasa hispida TaxID=102211 RepID=UPI001900DB8D|nr:salicylic acid-binding protein 2-like isoform X1 [Benincasa hispida]